MHERQILHIKYVCVVTMVMTHGLLPSLQEWQHVKVIRNDVTVIEGKRSAVEMYCLGCQIWRIVAGERLIGQLCQTAKGQRTRGFS